MVKPTSKVYLVGAGPGHPELITARGLRLLRAADVVLYDALVHPELLREARPDAEKVFVGKRAGRVSERQADINRRMAEAAQAGQTVVRLKGGDPFLFGRGSEEAEHLAAEGVAFEVVPGVPSPMAATAFAGISLTHRTHASSVAYVTATESVEKDRSSHDWSKLATATETLVIFMGMRKLPTLMSLLMEHGRAPDTPAAVVEWASLPRQRTVVGTVATIAERARVADIGRPALTIVGQVVELRETLRWFDTLPLFGKRVLVTRPEHQADDFARDLRDRGAEPVTIAAIRIVPPADPAPLARAVREASRYRWVVFTSANGVRAFFDAVAEAGLDARALGAARVCAIGPATATSLGPHGIRPDVVPEEFRGEGVAEAILAADPGLAGHAVLLPRAEVAREALPDMLRAAGAQVDVVSAYRTLGCDEDDAARLRSRVEQGSLEVITFTSPSTVREVAAALGPLAEGLDRRLTLAAIGPVTAEAAAARGWTVHVSPAHEYTGPALVDALEAHFAEATA